MPQPEHRNWHHQPLLYKPPFSFTVWLTGYIAGAMSIIVALFVVGLL